MQRGSTTEDENVVAALYSPLIKGAARSAWGLSVSGMSKDNPTEGSATVVATPSFPLL